MGELGEACVQRKADDRQHPEGCDGEGGVVQDGEHVYTHG